MQLFEATNQLEHFGQGMCSNCTKKKIKIATQKTQHQSLSANALANIPVARIVRKTFGCTIVLSLIQTLFIKTKGHLCSPEAEYEVPVKKPLLNTFVSPFTEIRVVRIIQLNR